MTPFRLAFLWPPRTGYHNSEPCLCIGLDIAWFGGSKNKPDTQNDCLVYAVVRGGDGSPTVHLHPVKLENRDPNAEQIFRAIKEVIQQNSSVERVVLAIDAPLQGCGIVPCGKKRARRHCEDTLSEGRKAIDKEAGGANDWHPNIQPGLPLAPRVQNLLGLLTGQLGMKPWTQGDAQDSRLIIECFPAEAIWAAKRLGGYGQYAVGTTVKCYKKQQGVKLPAANVTTLVNRVLLNAFEKPSGMPSEWPRMVGALVGQMLSRPGWQVNGKYRGGKLLDDVVDSAICFAVALSYAHGRAHVWFDPANPNDGHIIGPGT